MEKLTSASSSWNRASRIAAIYLRRLGLRNGVLLAVATVAMVLALNPDWLTAAGLPPLLLLSLPGVALWALGTCKIRGRESDLSFSVGR